MPIEKSRETAIVRIENRRVDVTRVDDSQPRLIADSIGSIIARTVFNDVARARIACSRLLERKLAEIILLPEVHAVVAQERVRGREVEEEVRRHVLAEVVGAGHRLPLP